MSCLTRRERESERENVASCEINKRQLRVIARVSGRTRIMHGRDGEILTACIVCNIRGEEKMGLEAGKLLHTISNKLEGISFNFTRGK